jgi:DNA-binding CsgD family transcriptional regulator
MNGDLLSIIEAAYDLERSDAAWVDGLLAAAGPLLDGGMGIGGYFFDASTTPMRTWAHSTRAGLDLQLLLLGCATFTDDYRRANWLTRRFGTLHQFPDAVDHVAAEAIFAATGIRDVVAVNALDPTGLGFWIAAPQPKLRPLGPEDEDRWSRVVAHVSAAVRLRARLARVSAVADPTKHADAVLSPSGKIEDAQGDAATLAARNALREAARAIEKARGPVRKRDLDGALGEWRTLVRSRWTLVDHFESDGRRYVLAHTNIAAPAAPPELSAREREVLERAILGRENKLIAYELGLAASTVRVLMRRAAGKLGAKTREGAIEAYRRSRSGDGEP